MNGEAILEEFYDAIIKRDMVKARTYLDDDMHFVGLFEIYPSADDYIATFVQLMSIVTRLDVKVTQECHSLQPLRWLRDD